MTKLTPYQTKKYDINQKIISELANMESRLILFSIVNNSLPSMEISRKLRVPLSTVYKKLQDLQRLSLVYVEKTDFSERNVKTKYYKSIIKGAEISFRKLEPKLTLHSNK